MNSTEEERLAEINRVFRARFGTQATLWCRAPGRVDLMGSHTDYNLGFVLTLPIGCDTWIAARPREDSRCRIYSENLKATTVFDLEALQRDQQNLWDNYVRGVAWSLRSEALKLCGFDGVVHSTVPICSGLSSSAALECAVATVFEALGGWKIDPVKKALLCQRAENEFVGVHCGILDQYTACVGREGCALLLDCRDLSSRAVKLPAGVRVVICDTKSKRELAGSEYGERRADCEQGARDLGARALRDLTPEQFHARKQRLTPLTAKRCQFIVEENARVLRLAEALESDHHAQIASLTAESFQGACDLYEIGIPAMHSMMGAMQKAAGVIGARQAGAGFGGCMVAFVEEPKVQTFQADVRSEYFARTGINPEVYAVKAAPGASLIQRLHGAVVTGSDSIGRE